MRSGSIQRRLSIFVAGLFVFGACGFVIIEGWSFLDAAYMTLITLSTVGYGEIQELTPKGRMFTSVLVTVSLVSMACWTGGITSMLVSGELTGRFYKQRVLKMIAQMSDHVVVCGGGVTAMTIVRRLHAQNQQVVMIVQDAAEIEALKNYAPNVPVICDDPKSEMAMADANIMNAKYLIAAVDCDYDNLLITITGKSIGTDLEVISCAQSMELASRMMKVGANEVICPFVISGEHVASLIESPCNAS